jgi:hypothetical protein
LVVCPLFSVSKMNALLFNAVTELRSCDSAVTIHLRSFDPHEA